MNSVINNTLRIPDELNPDAASVSNSQIMVLMRIHQVKQQRFTSKGQLEPIPKNLIKMTINKYYFHNIEFIIKVIYIMYKTIVNPETGRKVKVNGKISQKVLNNYKKQYGGAY